MQNQEPWFDLSLNSFQISSANLEWDKEDEIYWNQNQRQSDKHNFYMRAFDFISSNQIDGDYFEFGCHRCRTFRMAMLEARRHFLHAMKFHAFDSFEGLPSVSSNHSVAQWKQGSLSTDVNRFVELIKLSGFDISKVTVTQGFYDSSLDSEPAQLIFGNNKAALVNVDCDFYESAIPIFKNLDRIIQEGTILYIDDYFSGYKGNPTKGVSAAMSEWSANSSWKLEEYHYVGWGGKSFIVY